MANIHYVQDYESQPSNQGLQPGTQQGETSMGAIKRLLFPKFTLYSATTLLIATNFLFYLLLSMVSFVSSSSYDCILYKVGALYPPDLRSFQIHRLIIPIVLHFGFWHILLNTISLLFLGYEIEERLGRSRYLMLYFGASVNGFLFSCVGYPSTLTAGASAAILGLFGYYVARMFFKASTMDNRSYAVFMYLVLFNFLMFLNPQNGNIFAHLGGLYFGVLFMLLLDPPTAAEFPNVANWQNYAKIGLIAFPIFMVLLFILIPSSKEPICIS